MLEEAVLDIAKKDIHANAGEEFRYSNYGMVIVARIAEVVTKKRFEQLMRTRIFVPLGMRNTSFVTDDGSAPNPANGAKSTATDYAKFLQMFMNGGEFNNVRILSRKTIELMMTNQLHHTIDRQFGLGFGLETTANDHSSISSIGTFEWGGAFNTDFWADPKEKMIGLFYTNIYQSPAWDVTEKFKVLSYQAVID